jgi:glycosyltransferase involved in cell wall biosynthesis
MKFEQLRVGIIAPPWTPLPPSHSGATRYVLDALARGLTDRGHEVVLVAAGSPDYDAEALMGCDIVHDHSLAGPFLRELQSATPVVATNHGHFSRYLADRYRRCRDNVPMIAISHDQAAAAPSGVDVAAVIHHGLDLNGYNFDPDGGDYLLAVGRMRPCSGLDWAIDTARRVGLPLLISGKMRTPIERRYYVQEIKPRLGRGIEYVGETDHATKIELLRGARALLSPNRKVEPFGLLLIEALACGTPVITCPIGAAPEVVEHGTTGYLADNPRDLVRAVRSTERLDRRSCRTSVEQRFSMNRMAIEHERFYRAVAERRLLDDQMLRPAAVS